MQWFVLLAFVFVLLFALVRFQLSLLVWTATIAGSWFSNGIMVYICCVYDSIALV